MSAVIDPFILEHAPGPLVELDPALVRARVACAELLNALVAVPDSDLEYSWTWEGDENEVRYGFYRAVELLQLATSESRRLLADSPSTEARDAAAAATQARWALQGVLATLTDADLDVDPGNDQWTVRQTMGHIIGGQRGYAWGSAWWLSRRDQPRPPGAQRPPAEVFAAIPEDDDEARGSLADIRQALDDVVDSTSSRYATLTPEDMLVIAGWAGIPVTIGFRQWRWSSHIQEHTIQIEKTLDMVGRRRSEVDWLSRLIGQAFGRFGATVFGRESAGAAAPVFERVARDLNALHPSIVAAANAAVPLPEDW